MLLKTITVSIIHMRSPFQVGTASLLIFPTYFYLLWGFNCSSSYEKFKNYSYVSNCSF